VSGSFVNIAVITSTCVTSTRPAVNAAASTGRSGANT
jgi:hypothetical protein